jgi:hypothetical protein
MRLDREMTLHDAAMSRFGQWWTRARRAGYAYAQGAALHGKSPERHWVRECMRGWFWAGVVPLATFLAVLSWGQSGLLVLILYLLLWTRTFLNTGPRQIGIRNAALWASACVLCKFPELFGQLLFWWRTSFRAEPTLIEYKTVPTR